ncbi:hypothetical protein AXG93_969s1010 [Marchantia polymorpha subsp. ruderalis]|nr:hypothetical protein AXG93_969s1010 [Marchantia polymorpha subsp. ruderalis]
MATRVLSSQENFEKLMADLARPNGHVYSQSQSQSGSGQNGAGTSIVAKNTASILAIGKALPPNRICQSTYTDFYFRVTHCSHKTELKNRMQRICDKSGINTRYLLLDEEALKEHSEFYTPGQASIEQRHDLLEEAVPKLAAQAAASALEEWGRPACDVTHLIVVTLSGVAIPGADVRLVKLLGLREDVSRVMLYMLGCYAGVTALRLAKDLAENNPGSRVLIACSEMTATTFRAPSEKSMYDIVGASLFGDGAVGVIVGAKPRPGIERSIFEIHWAGVSLAPDTEHVVQGKLKPDGLYFFLDKSLPGLVGKHIAPFCRSLLDHAPENLNLGFNEVFWAVHPGGPAILNTVEEQLLLNSEKLRASRDVLANYGNVSASSVLYVLDELRHRPGQEEWGAALAFGPGITFEGVLLRRNVNHR